MTDKLITCAIDWLQYSVEWTDSDPAISRRRGLLSTPLFDDFRQTKARVSPYPITLAMIAGIVAYSQHEQWRRIYYQFTGSDISVLFAEGILTPALLAHAAACGGRFSRIDFAIDVYGYGASPIALDAMWKQGRLKTRVQHAGLQSSSDRQPRGTLVTGDTFYLGSPKGRQQLRVYNKGVQTGEGGDWTRIELVTRHEAAQVLGEAMVISGIEAAGRSAIMAFVTIDLDWWTAAVLTAPVELAPLPIHANKTYEWLLQQCLPALEREVAGEIAQGRYTLYERFTTALRDAYHLANMRDLTP
jgi:hypothetical protein